MYSAGILIYAKHNSRIKFLLGRDSKYFTWSDFGGKNDSIDNKCNKRTAAREFYEESCGVIQGISETLHMLEDKIPYICKSYMNHDYFMYVLEIEYDDSIIQKFDKIRRMLNYTKISYRFAEKDILQWMDIDEIKKNKEIFRCVFYTSFMKYIQEITTKIGQTL